MMKSEREKRNTEEPVLQETDAGLVLRKGDLILRGDFAEMIPRLKKNNLQQELLVRASGILKKNPGLLAIDATAGMGEDSLLLAAAGFRGILFERDPVIAALLRDTMKRAESIPELAAIIGRMELREEDSIAALKAMSETSQSGDTPELIYLDPMFPARSKSGLIKKKFQLLQQLEAPEMNGEELLQAAFTVHPRRIVIKRPLKGELLGGIKPSFSLEGKAIRYDGHVLVP